MNNYTKLAMLATIIFGSGCIASQEQGPAIDDSSNLGCVVDADCSPVVGECIANMCFGGICTIADLHNPRIRLPIDPITGVEYGSECREAWSCSANCPPAEPMPCIEYACEGPHGEPGGPICVGRSVPDGTPCEFGTCAAGFCK